MKATKRFLSVLIASALMCASVGAVNAAGSTSGSGETSGGGSAEGYVDMEFLNVVLPTTDMSFIVDPEGLIKQSGTGTTGAAALKYKGVTIDYKDKGSTKDTADREDGFVFFTQMVTNGKTTTKTMRNYLDLTVENKSTFGVTIKPTLTYTDGTVNKKAIGCVGEVNKPDGTALGKSNVRFNLYLKDRTVTTSTTDPDTGEAVEQTQTIPYTLVTDKEAMTKNLDGAAAYYKVTYTQAGGYTYAIDNTAYDKADKSKNTTTYTLEGISNPAATNWETVTNGMNTEASETTTVTQPGVKITWTYTKS